MQDRADIRRYTRSPELQARWELARQEAQEKLAYDAKPIYEFIRGECELLPHKAAADPTLCFFKRYRSESTRWWLRMGVIQLWGQPSLKHLHQSHFKAALHWLVKEGYILQDNFDKDYCTIKWYAIGDKPFPQGH